MEALADSSKERLRQTSINELSRPETRNDPDPPQMHLPAKRRRPKWAPFTTKPTFIFFFFLTTIAIIIFIELLYQKSEQDQGILFSNSKGKFTMLQIFYSRYLLTIISVLYGMVWGSADLNIKRLEPFYQLSKGATAANSLFLNYPFDFLAFVPVTSFLRRHWSVFCSGTALLLIYWAITPLQAALLATDILIKDIPTQFVQTAEILPFEQQAAKATLHFFYDAYGVSWLGQKLLPFTTTEYAAIPFKPVSDGLSGGNFTGVTKTYTTGLDCIPADNKGLTFTGTQWAWETEYGPEIVCSWSPTHLPGVNQSMNYTSVQLMTPCTQRLDLFMGWAVEERGPLDVAFPGGSSTNSTAPSGNMTAIYCKPHYSYIDARITLDVNMAILHAEPLGNPISFTQNDSIIDVRAFQDLISNMQDWSTDTEDFRDIDTRYYQSTPSKLLDWGLENILGYQSPLIGYAIAMSPGKTFEDFMDPKVLQEGLERLHKLLFSNFIVSSVLQDLPMDGSKAKKISGIHSLAFVRVAVNGTSARLLEGFLTVVAVCFAFLGILSFRRKANLFSDPDSLAAKMTLVTHSKNLPENFSGLDESPKLEKRMKNHTYRLEISDHNGSYQINCEDDPISDIFNLTEDSDIQELHSRPVPATRPLVLKIGVGIIFGLFLAFLLGFLVFLYKYAEKNNGLPIISQNPFWIQIVFSFIPTALATVMEPLWVLITRFFCVYQPYSELSKGRASPTVSLGLRYIGVPPTLVLFRALQAKHPVLFLLSVTTLLANLLAVSLGGLFQHEFRLYATSSLHAFLLPSTTLIHPQIHPSSWTLPTSVAAGLQSANMPFSDNDVEHFIVAKTNITQGTPLPAWITKDFYFQPFEWDYQGNYSTGATSHKTVTRGFGGSVDCQPLENSIFRSAVSTDIPSTMSVNITLSTNDGGEVLCGGFLNSTYRIMTGEWRRTPQGNWTQELQYIAGQNISGHYAIQMRPMIEEQQSQAANETCGSVLVIGWSRTVAVDSRSVKNALATDNRYKNITLVCQPKLKTGMFEVTVDPDQRVQEYRLLGPSEYHSVNLTDFLQDTTIGNFTRQMSLFLQSFGIGAGRGSGEGVLYFKNDSTPFTFPHALTDNLSNVSLSDPNQPLANFETFSHAYGELYQRLIPIVFGLNARKIFVKGTSDMAIAGTTISVIQRAVMDPTMFYITVIILSINLIVAVIVYLSRPNILPRFPDTLASEIAYFYASQALQDVGGTEAMSSSDRDRHLKALGHQYGYGYFVGRDGKKHRGVERSSLLG